MCKILFLFLFCVNPHTACVIAGVNVNWDFSKEILYYLSVICYVLQTTREHEIGAVGGVAEFHDKLLKPHDSRNLMPTGEHALEFSNQPQPQISAGKLLVECNVQPWLEECEYDCEIRNKEPDQDRKFKTGQLV